MRLQKMQMHGCFLFLNIAHNNNYGTDADPLPHFDHEMVW